MPPAKKEVCDKGHCNWRTAKNGNRYCRTCHDARNRKRDRRKIKSPHWGERQRLGDRGGTYETWSRSEILKARGYM